jgi:hypothetical protein
VVYQWKSRDRGSRWISAGVRGWSLLLLVKASDLHYSCACCCCCCCCSLKDRCCRRSFFLVTSSKRPEFGVLRCGLCATCLSFLPCCFLRVAGKNVAGARAVSQCVLLLHKTAQPRTISGPSERRKQRTRQTPVQFDSFYLLPWSCHEPRNPTLSPEQVSCIRDAVEN